MIYFHGLDSGMPGFEIGPELTPSHRHLHLQSVFHLPRLYSPLPSSIPPPLQPPQHRITQCRDDEPNIDTTIPRPVSRHRTYIPRLRHEWYQHAKRTYKCQHRRNAPWKQPRHVPRRDRVGSFAKGRAAEENVFSDDDARKGRAPVSNDACQNLVRSNDRAGMAAY